MSVSARTPGSIRVDERVEVIMTKFAIDDNQIRSNPYGLSPFRSSSLIFVRIRPSEDHEAVTASEPLRRYQDSLVKIIRRTPEPIGAHVDRIELADVAVRAGSCPARRFLVPVSFRGPLVPIVFASLRAIIGEAPVWTNPQTSLAENSHPCRISTCRFPNRRTR